MTLWRCKSQEPSPQTRLVGQSGLCPGWEYIQRPPCQDHLLRSQNSHPSRPEPSHLWGSSTPHSQNQRTQMAEDRALTTRAWTLPKEKKDLEELQDAE